MTASKRHCWMVWTNYGIGRSLLCFLSEYERIEFQQANKFVYDIAISRVETKVSILWYAYFIWSDGGRLDKTMFKVNLSTLNIQQLKSPVSNYNWASVQLGNRSIYQLCQDRLRLLSVDHSGVISVHQKAQTLHKHGPDAAMSNFSDKSLVLTGGKDSARLA